MRRARTSTIFAFVCVESVTIPACEPVSDVARWPRSISAIAASEHEIRSPTETSMSSSRGSGWAVISWASRIRSSVVSPIAESTATTRFPASRAAAQRCATAWSFCVSATEEPPNFITTTPGDGAAWSTAGTASYSAVVITEV